MFSTLKQQKLCKQKMKRVVLGKRMFDKAREMWSVLLHICEGGWKQAIKRTGNGINLHCISDVPDSQDLCFYMLGMVAEYLRNLGCVRKIEMLLIFPICGHYHV